MGGEGGGDGGGGEGGEVAAMAVATGTGGGEGARSTLSEVDQRPTLVSSTVILSIESMIESYLSRTLRNPRGSWHSRIQLGGRTPILYPQSTEISVNLISN
jgi:hypothetical protein